MDTTTLDARLAFKATSSRLLEEVPSPSGIRFDASIEGCLFVANKQDVWSALLEPLGNERTRYVPVQQEECVYQEVASTIRDSALMVRKAHSLTRTQYILLSPHHGSGGAFVLRNLYVVHLGHARQAGYGTLLKQETEYWERVVPDTARSYSLSQMSNAWKAIGQPLLEDDVPLSVDPDDYPLN